MSNDREAAAVLRSLASVEPVAWINEHGTLTPHHSTRSRAYRWTPLYAAPAAPDMALVPKDCAAEIIHKANAVGEFVTGDDGYVVYWPHFRGAYSEWMLRALADELGRRNAECDAMIAAAQEGKDE